MAKMRPVPLPELLNILPLLPLKYQAIAAIGATTGCRITEILSLRRRDLISKDGKIRNDIEFLNLKQREGPKHIIKTIPADFHDYIIRHLTATEEQGYDRPDDYVFPGYGGKHLSRRQAYRTFRRILGLRHGTHWMRKTFAREIYNRNCMDYDRLTAAVNAQAALGHERLDTTLKYLEIVKNDNQKYINEIFNIERIRHEQ